MADYALIELVIVFGGAMLLIGWQYWSVTRDIRRRENREALDRQDKETPSPSSAAKGADAVP
ncbi:hypothetical protein GCM10011316_02520 [Roseibium aquae]|uniref:Heme exporter protein D n=1 Tax=Roseibium aquae TaxID=1323746 RepID=A0A916WUK8_9HYPH|nr:hypothetical protein [Roseibium aquae]GGB33936.1 hypothetical protein GCM10011316_02520 [Roseibium aquae]